MAEQDYLDKRWAKTGCKPLNKQTKNALIPTDVQIQVRDNLNQLTGELINEQRLYFRIVKLALKSININKKY